MQRNPALRYGSVCLRREQFCFARRMFDSLCRQDDILRCAAELRELIHISTGAGADEWYFRAPQPGRKSRPRYLDLRNPLSVHTFRKDIVSLPGEALISLTQMEPSRAHAYSDNNGPFLTEVMIEV